MARVMAEMRDEDGAPGDVFHPDVAAQRAASAANTLPDWMTPETLTATSDGDPAKVALAVYEYELGRGRQFHVPDAKLGAMRAALRAVAR